jgi:hypothetical protein
MQWERDTADLGLNERKNLSAWIERKDRPSGAITVAADAMRAAMVAEERRTHKIRTPKGWSGQI